MSQYSLQFDAVNGAQNNAVLLLGHLTTAMHDHQCIAPLLLFPRNLSIDRVAQQPAADYMVRSHHVSPSAKSPLS
jgi:hypothetical protein